MADQGSAVRPAEPDADVARSDRLAIAARGTPIFAAESPTPAGEQPRVRMRQRIARLGTTRPQTPALDPLVRIIRANHPKADLSSIERAYQVAEELHRGQLRKSGDAFITHPLAVTTILAELGMTETTLCASLLHDTVEDTDYSLAQLTRDFGEGSHSWSTAAPSWTRSSTASRRSPTPSAR